MVPPLEQAAAAAFLNNVMGKLFQALGLVGETYKMLKDLELEGESLLQDLRMLAAAVDDELTTSRGARRTAVARAYSTEMRALTHDVEDCIERFVHRVTGGGRLEGASRLRRAAHAVWTLRTCYRFAGKIKKLKKRVQEASARVLKPPEGGGGGGGGVGQPSGSRAAAGRRAADHASRRPVGIERPVEELLALLGLDQVEDRPQTLAPEQPRVIAIVGFGGVGKTTLARAVYDAAPVADAFPCRAWVTMRSPEDGDAAGILENIYQQLLPGQQFSESSLTKYLKNNSTCTVYDAAPVDDAFPCRAWVAVRSPEEGDAAGILENIYQQLLPGQQFSESSLTKYLKNKRYLIVIDDVDVIEEEQWDTITSAFEGNGEGSRIIVTTTFRPTANRRSDTNGCVYKMRTLGMRDSMTVALRGRCAAELVQGSETLLKKCDGLPLALVSVARQLSSEDEPTGKFCSELCSKLGSYLEREDGEPNFARLRDVLIENYASLSDLTVRTCLLYLGIFPIECPLRKNVIIRRWMAEGYARSEDITLSEQSVANGNLKTFIDRNIILPVKISKIAEVKTCKAHGIVHEFLLHRSMCEKFIMCSPRDKIVRHIFVHGDVGSDTNSPATWKMDLSRVRSLTVHGSSGGSINDFGKYKLIRVLDLEECTDMKDGHLKKICKLWNLRYLSLGHNITRLPKEIAKLKLLETLALSKKVVTMLPVEVIGLPCLTNLIGKLKLSDQDWKSSSEQERLSKRKEWEELCRNSKMETLAGFVVNAGQLQGFLHLMLHMKNLRKVKIWCESTEDIDDFNNLNNDLIKAIRQYTRAPMGAGYVRSMSIDFQGLPHGSLHALQDLYKHSMSLQETYYLSSLKLYGDLSASHEFVAIVSGLTELCLSSATMARALLLSLSAMPFLLYLTLITDEIEDFIITAGAFQSLRRLRFVLQQQNLVLPKIEEGALPELVSLQVPCKYLAGPSGTEIKHLRKLQEIELHPQVSKQARQEWEAAARNHHNRPNVLPFISIDDLVGDDPTNNPVTSSKKSGLEEAAMLGQLSNQASGRCAGHIPLSTCNNPGLGNEMDLPPNHVTMENRIVIQGRPAKEASKETLLLTDQQGNYTSTELGHASSCYNSASLPNASNCARQFHANGLVNDDLR